MFILQRHQQRLQSEGRNRSSFGQSSIVKNRGDGRRTTFGQTSAVKGPPKGIHTNKKPGVRGQRRRKDAKSPSVKKKKHPTKRKQKKKVEEQPVEPRADSLSPNATFSACLLIRDDNDILPEWIAYHYHVLGLRSLIVAVDPLSQESPSDVLMKWRLMTDLKILEWDDRDYMPGDFLSSHRPPDQFMQKEEDFPDPDARLEISNHRYRQRVFLAKCLQRLKKDRSTWVLHTDTDEFIVPSKLLRQMKPKYLRMPSMSEPNAVLNLIQQTVNKTAKQVNYPCLSLLRVLFGSVESLEEEKDMDVPPSFQGSRFETLRWRHHALPHNMTINGNPKVLLDVSAIPEKYFHDDVVFSIHRPVQKFCHVNTELEFTHFRQQPIAVNHYLGSWERYSRRNDKRRSREVYDSKAFVQRGTDDGARLWLKGFVNNVGQDVAEVLLESYTKPKEIDLGKI